MELRSFHNVISQKNNKKIKIKSIPMSDLTASTNKPSIQPQLKSRQKQCQNRQTKPKAENSQLSTLSHYEIP